MKTKTTPTTYRRKHPQTDTKNERLHELHGLLENGTPYDIDALAKKHNACRKTVLADIRAWKRERGLYHRYACVPKETRMEKLRGIEDPDIDALCEEFNVKPKTLKDDLAALRMEREPRKDAKPLLHEQKSPFRQVTKRPVEDRFLYNAF